MKMVLSRAGGSSGCAGNGDTACYLQFVPRQGRPIPNQVPAVACGEISLLTRTDPLEARHTRQDSEGCAYQRAWSCGLVWSIFLPNSA